MSAAGGDHRTHLARPSRLDHHLLHLPAGRLPNRRRQTEQGTGLLRRAREEAHGCDHLVLHIVCNQIAVLAEAEEKVRVGLVKEADEGTGEPLGNEASQRARGGVSEQIPNRELHMRKEEGNHGGGVQQLLHLAALHHQENAARFGPNHIDHLLSIQRNHDLQIHNAG